MIQIVRLQKLFEWLGVGRWDHNIDGVIETPGFSPEIVIAALLIVKFSNDIEWRQIFCFHLENLVAF